eukprot:5869692-Pyramimonas_sp.AAC.1
MSRRTPVAGSVSAATTRCSAWRPSAADDGDASCGDSASGSGAGRSGGAAAMPAEFALPTA